MDLIKMVSEKAGIPTDKANIAIQTVVGFLKDKMPGGVGDQVAKFVNAAPIAKVAEGVEGKVGDLLHK